jgi:UDP-glucose 4-epimerase
MRCLVTGGTGFIGSHLVRMLLKRGCHVAVLVRPEANRWRIQDDLASLLILDGNLAEIRMVRDQIKKFQPQVLIHAGWQGVTREQRDDLNQIDYNLHGSLELLSVCLDAGCQCVIGLGSQAEYGKTDEQLVEDMQAQPDTMYGVTKLCTGLLSQRICANRGARFSWLRLTAAYGPKDDPSHLIPYVISTLLRGEEPALTRGNQKWDYLYIEDVVNAIWSLIEHPSAQGIFNLSSSRATPIAQISEMIRDRIDPRLSLGFGRIASQDGERMVLEAKNDRLHKATGWEPLVSLEKGINTTVEWYSQQYHL